MAENTWLVAGLGNPGPGYSGNRHNVGFMVVDALAERLDMRWGLNKASALTAEGFVRPGGSKIILVKPQTFMNESGRAVGPLAQFHGIPASHIIVVHDELDVPFDTVRLKWGGGHGGHNGIRSISAALHGEDFTRVRVGLGRPPGQMDPAAFVLNNFSAEERKVLPVLVADAADAVEAVIEEGILAAQQRFHSPT